jgi:phosphatidylglycerol:prolipoprotein diacylglycerol transferase
MIKYPNINPVAFQIYNLKIHWYAIGYIATFIIGQWFVVKYIKNFKLQIKENQLDSWMNYIILGLIIGARLFYCLVYDLKYCLQNPFEIFYIWHGGLSFHGGAIGVITGTYIFAKKNKLNFATLVDILAALTPIGSFFGRISNFINAELYGRATNLAIGIIFPTDPLQIPRHPSQLYECLLEGILTFTIMQYLVWKKNALNKPAFLTSIFGLLYATSRFFVEFFREPDQQIGYLFNFLTTGQLMSIIMISISIFIFIKYARK